MTEESGTIPESGQDGALNVAAPAVDATADGQGGKETPAEGQFAGFNTPEELVDAYSAQTGELTTSKEQYDNLRTLDGRRSTELGQLRTQNATLSGQIEGMKVTAAPAVAAVPSGPSVDDIRKRLDDGEIDEGEAMKLTGEAYSRDTESRLIPQFRQMLDTQKSELKQEADDKEYEQKFISENTGYQEAFDSGKLDQWLSKTPDGKIVGGEFAWAQYQLQSKKAEIQSLKEKAGDAAQKAGEQGIEHGRKIEQGKSAAGKVLTGKGGQMSQTSSNLNLSNKADRTQAGVELLNRMRSG